MDRQAYIDEIKFRLSGGILNLELDDVAFNQLLNSSFREVQRYIDTTKLVTIPYSSCIDVNTINNGHVNAVARIFRSEGYISNSETGDSNGGYPVDPMEATQWQLLSGVGNLYNFNDYVYNYASWNTLLQIRNTTSTDLAFKFDRSSNKLYVNVSSGIPDKITVEYIPRYDDVSEIVSDYWIDIIIRMAVALGKVTLGRIRTRYTQSNALWTQDGQLMLDEGNNELNDLREKLQAATQLCYPID